MIEVLQLPETCCATSSTSSGGSNGGGGGGTGSCDCEDWILEGEVNPEGAITADRRKIYLWRDASHFRWFYKGSGDGTPFGWVEYHTVA